MTNGGRSIRNADLWEQVDALLSARSAGSFKVTKVKGHATHAHVKDGLVSSIDKMGNDAADALAVAGALANCRAPMAKEFWQKTALTLQLHNMMLDILNARNALRSQQEDTEDATSEDSSEADDDSMDDEDVESSGGSDWYAEPPD